MAARSLVDRMAVRVGYCTDTTAALTIAALQDAGTLAVSCSGGAVAIAVPLTGLGGDHPTYGAGQFPLYYAKVNITGLTAGTLYSYTATKNGITVSGSFRTMPASGQDYAFFMSTCERGAQFSPVDVHALMLEYAAAQSVPVYFYAHIDDNWYADSDRNGWGSPTATDAVSGLALSNTGTGGNPEETGLSWDYCVNWAGYFGLLDTWQYASRPSRKVWAQNMPLWAQWGDHEVASNWQRGHGGQGSWYAPKELTGTIADADVAYVGTNNFFANVAKVNWEALFGQASPPKLRAGGQHWGATFGPVAFAAVDMNTYADGRHFLTTGSGTGCGRKADGSIDLGAAGDTTLPYLGTNQIGDLLGFYQSSAKPFNILFTSNGLASHNEPWGQWWVTDSDDLFKRTTTGVLNQSILNGTTGKLAILKGDTHSLHVISHHSDGTAGGLGGTAHNNKEVWEICPGTLNGSGTAVTSFQNKLFGQRMRFKHDAPASRGRDYHAFMHVTVYASESPQRVVMQMIDTTYGACEPVWSGQWTADVPGNAFQRVGDAPRFG